MNLLDPKHYYQEFLRMTQFVIHPYSKNSNDGSFKKKLEGTWTMFVVKMILFVLVGIIVAIIYDPDNKTTNDMMQRFSPIALFIVTVFLLPLLEEVAFRLSLTYKPIYFSFTVGVLIYYFVSKVFYQAKLSDINDHFGVRLGLTIASMLISYIIVKQPLISKLLIRVYKNNFRWILYAFCIGFAWIHILNYGITVEHVLLMPLITLPKLVNAFCYSYVRVKYGFLYCYILHMGTNTIGFSVNMLSN